MPVYKLPHLADPRQASVFDPWYETLFRKAAGILGDDPSSQTMGAVGPMAAAGEGLGPLASKSVSGVKKLAAQIAEIAPEAYEAVKGLKGKFYSRLTDAATRLPETGHPNKITQFLASQSAPEEAEYRGLAAFLKSKGNQMVPREDVLTHLRGNPITLGEKTLGEPNPNWGHRDMSVPNIEWTDVKEPTKYHGYQLPGGEHYRETLTTLPPRLETMKTPMYQSPHWPDDPNTLVHARTQERRLPGVRSFSTDPANPRNYKETTLGAKGRMIENVQSEWHQTGAKSGYIDPNQTIPTEMDVVVAYDKYKQALLQENPPVGHIDNPVVNEAWANWDRLRKLHEDGPQGVPDAPFKKSWPDLALKQQLYSAAEDPDISWMGVTPGEELVKRGEGHSPVFNNETIPNTISKLLKPFGGAERGIIDIPGKKPTFTWDPTGGRYGQAIDPSVPNTEGLIDLEHTLASHSGYEPDMFGNFYKLKEYMTPHPQPFMDALRESYPTPTYDAPKFNLTPEMKAAIAKRGFPIMSLLGLLGQQQQQQQAPPVAGPPQPQYFGIGKR